MRRIRPLHTDKYPLATSATRLAAVALFLCLVDSMDW
jgi:hypothetical protein